MPGSTRCVPRRAGGCRVSPSLDGESPPPPGAPKLRVACGRVRHVALGDPKMSARDHQVRTGTTPAAFQSPGLAGACSRTRDLSTPLDGRRRSPPLASRPTRSARATVAARASNGPSATPLGAATRQFPAAVDPTWLPRPVSEPGQAPTGPSVRTPGALALAPPWLFRRTWAAGAVNPGGAVSTPSAEAERVAAPRAACDVNWPLRGTPVCVHVCASRRGRWPTMGKVKGARLASAGGCLPASLAATTGGLTCGN
jgi:hypothetical protein